MRDVADILYTWIGYILRKKGSYLLEETVELEDLYLAASSVPREPCMGSSIML